MILMGKEIEKRLKKDIIIELYNAEQLNPNNYNLRLHQEIMLYSNVILDANADNPKKTITIPGIVSSQLYQELRKELGVHNEG